MFHIKKSHRCLSPKRHVVFLLAERGIDSGPLSLRFVIESETGTYLG